MKPIRVSLVVFPECDPSIIYGVYDTLWAAGWLWDALKGEPKKGRELFEPRLVAAEAGPMELITGVSIIPQDAITDVERDRHRVRAERDGGSGRQHATLDRRMLAWIRRMHGKGAQLYAACGGSLVLAEAGMLDGAEATTHWSYVPLFRKLYPKVTLHEERILVQTGPGHSIVCSGGASSWQDLTLLMIAAMPAPRRRSASPSCFSISGIATDSCRTPR